ncbi:DUF1775 domain-containing protein [Streptomyces sp. NPDC004284]|uniref:DUF1775 domain-containing protein n=1 Tax=Streptomyces sp. NPDC004284 TaxID=3364695 RepID=UPI00369BEA17
MASTDLPRPARRPGSEPESGALSCALRAALFSGVSTVLAVTGHHVASGHPVPWRMSATAGVLLFVLALPLVRGPRSLPTVVLVTTAVQGLLHFWLGLAGGHSHPAPHSMSAGGDAGRHMGHHGTSMTIAHLIAALLVAWLMHGADTAVRAAADGVGAAVVRLVARARPGRPVLPLVVRVHPAPPGTPPLPRSSLALAHAVVRRGPPDEPASVHRPRARRRSPARLLTMGVPVFRTDRRGALRRAPLALAAAVAASVALAGPAFAHVEVEAEGARALAENVTLSFSAESESPTEGITKLEVVLPAGITPADVTYKEGPKGWTLAATAPGYTVSGPAVAAGENAEYSVVVRQLPDAESLAFKTLQTYSDGRVDRWIELDKSHEGGHSGNPAPVLELQAAAPGATPVKPSPTTAPTTAAPTTTAPTTTASAATTAPSGTAGQEPANGAKSSDESKKSSANTPVLIGGAVVLLLAVAGAWLWNRRRGSRES